jgi:exopolysaccharide biosynthesis predicted pyruvyltransferase EpsI
MKKPGFVPQKWVAPLRKIKLQLKYRNFEAKINKKNSYLAPRRKIIYALVPPPELANIGDHAQVVAIRLWFKRHYPELQVLEVDKNEVIYGQGALKKIINTDDVIFLHSGGNLGDRGIWSETGRRMMIQNFPNNRIISLPQTIYFSNTEEGFKQKKISKEIYAQHKRLTVIGRDRESGELATELFPNAQILAIPDFVLSLQLEDFNLNRRLPTKNNIIACLRHDSESKFNHRERSQIIRSCGLSPTVVDTTLENPIEVDNRLKITKQFLETVLEHKGMVTDRFHGAIFSVLCGRPSLVLPTVDHKLTSAVEWFDEISSVKFCDDISELEYTLNALLQQNSDDCVNFREKYFDKLPDWLNVR